MVGDGAVGLCAVLAAKRHGAERIIAMSTPRRPPELAQEFGATDIVAERGEEAMQNVKEMTAGVGVDAALECVGTGQAMHTALEIARPGSIVGFVGVPHGVELPVETDVLPQRRRAGRPRARARLHPRADRRRPRRAASSPGRVLDYETDLEGVGEAYAAMDERRAIKSLVRVGSL